ncbi:MAG: hypothetical protein K0S74_1883 [Chlamydiales bacterium]|nr:hypothetical protein [Chlamydiales bacterium]
MFFNEEFFMFNLFYPDNKLIDKVDQLLVSEEIVTVQS